jgi:hypothetical protein
MGGPPSSGSVFAGRRGPLSASAFVVPAQVTAVLRLPSRSYLHEGVAADPVAAVGGPPADAPGYDLGLSARSSVDQSD